MVTGIVNVVMYDSSIKIYYFNIYLCTLVLFILKRYCISFVFVLG